MRVRVQVAGYSERCLEVGVTLEMGVCGHVVCDVKGDAKNSPGMIEQHAAGVK